jgi:carboxymethylenebutenolidase
MGQLIDIRGVAAYRADPPGEVKAGLVLIHEIWGLVDHIKAVADRFAAEGYLVIAPDLLSDAGVPPEVGADLFNRINRSDEATRLAAQPELRDIFTPTRSPEFAATAIASLRQVVDYLATEPGVDERIAVAGFCFGGTFSFALAAADERVRAAVPFYGSAPTPDRMGAIACSVLAIYGSRDERLIAELPTVIEAMADAGVDFTSKVYDGAAHAFFNDTHLLAYDPDAAADAWTRTLKFLDATLNRV